MYGTLRGALAGRKIAFDRDGYAATVEGRIVGVGKTIRIKSIHMRYELAVPAESREATERALALHPQGCPAHQSVQGAIDITWDARVTVGTRSRSFEVSLTRPPLSLDPRRAQPLTCGAVRGQPVSRRTRPRRSSVSSAAGYRAAAHLARLGPSLRE